MTKRSAAEYAVRAAPRVDGTAEVWLRKGFAGIRRVYLAVEYGLMLVGGVLIGVMMAFTTLDVIFRKLFNEPIVGTFEMMEFMMAGVIFLGLAYVERVKGHVAIEFLSSRFPPKVRRTVHFVGNVVGGIVFVAIAWKTGENAYKAWLVADYTPGGIALPTWPARSALPIGAGLLSIRLFAEAIGTVAAIVRGTRSAEAAHQLEY